MINEYSQLLLSLAGVVVGAGLALLAIRGRGANLRTDLEAARGERDAARDALQIVKTELALKAQEAVNAAANRDETRAALQERHTELENLRALLTEAQVSLSKARTELDTTREAHAEKIAELTNVREAIDKDLKLLAQAALEKNNEAFLRTAKETFEAHKKLELQEMDKRRDAVEQLVKPLGKTLEEYQKQLSEMEKARKGDEGRIIQNLQTVTNAQIDLKTETSRLVNALRAAPKTRGRWGEQQLRNVMEMAGMMEFVDFLTEHTLKGDEQRLRPDAILRLPGGRALVIDAKTPMAAYLDALEAVDEDQRDAKLRDHARQLRTHMKQLGDKKYWNALDVAPDFVVMFVPGENLFAAAIERDPELFRDGVECRVLVTTPTTFIALAQAIAYGWRQEKISQNAQQVMRLGDELYRRMIQLGERVEGVTKALDTAVKRHNDLVGTLEARVLPQARKFGEMGIGNSGGEIPVFEPVQTDVREPRKDRDLVFDSPPSITSASGKAIDSDAAAE